jgi:hypothetical protein
MPTHPVGRLEANANTNTVAFARLAVFGLCLAGLSLPPGCSGEEAPKAESDECRLHCPSTTGVDLMSPTVSFSTEVMPIFEKNCTEQLCHGNAEGPRAELYLGPAEGATESDVALVYADLKRPSKTAASLMLVEPGNPEQSFMMLKVDGCQNTSGLNCAPEPNLCRSECGDPMPPLPRDTYVPLDDEAKLTLRRWIAQGALP